MSDISIQLTKNTMLLNENIKIQQDTTENSNKNN